MAAQERARQKGRRPGRPRGRSNSRERVLDAAENLFARHGIGGVGLREIAAAAGIRASSLIHLFGCRDGLIDAVIERAARDLDAALASATDPRALGRALTAWTQAKPDRLRLLALAALTGADGGQTASQDTARPHRQRAMTAIWPIRNAMQRLARAEGLALQAELAGLLSAHAFAQATAPLLARAAGVEAERWRAALDQVIGRWQETGLQEKAK